MTAPDSAVHAVSREWERRLSEAGSDNSSTTTADVVEAVVNASVSLLTNLTGGGGDDVADVVGDVVGDVAPPGIGVDEGEAPAPPSDGTMPGGTILMMFAIVVSGLFISSVICVMRGTGSMPKFARYVCFVVDG